MLDDGDGVELRPFPTTRWSLVTLAAASDAETKREALGVLLQRYLPALRAHLRLNKGLSPDKSEDLLQGFIADKVVEQDLIAQARRDKGRFRSFLLVALNRYVISQARRDQALCRHPAGGGLQSLACEAAAAPEDAGPSQQFDLAWAREVIAEAERRMHLQCEDSGRADIWEMFKRRLAVDPGDTGGPRAGSPSSAASAEAAPFDKRRANLLVTAKRSFGRMVRSVIAEYVRSEREVEEEIQDLRRVLERA